MSVKLKVLHGSIQKRGKWQLTVPIKRSPFVIGQAADCNMRCFGRSMSDYHCEIRVAGFDVFLRDLESRSGTFINGRKLVGEQRFNAGDQLRLGRLAFELLIELPARTAAADDFAEFVSELLAEADEAERRERVRTPEARWYQIEKVPAADPYEGMTVKERLIAKARKKLPPKQDKPLKLPKHSYVAESTDQAVSECLATYFHGINPDSSGWNVSET